MRRLAVLCLLPLLVGAVPASDHPAEWTRPTAPFPVAGPISYVGTAGIGVYLIRTSAGLILLDGGMQESASSVERSIRALGFNLRDVKVMIATHAHYDLAGALAQLKRDTGARFFSSPGDRKAYKTGTPPSDVDYGVVRFPPVKVGGMLVDGRPVRLGNVAITPIFTPGHTPGCTSWMLPVREGRRTLRVLFPCSLSVAGNKLVGNQGYPGIVTDYRNTFARIRTLKADIVMPAHPEFADVIGRGERKRQGKKDAFLDPGLIAEMIAKAERQFEQELKKEERIK